MTKEEVMMRAKGIFVKWMNKPMGEKVSLLRQQMNPKGGLKKVYLHMQQNIYRSVQGARAFWVELQRRFKQWDTQGVLQIHACM
jgi:hypothetical protein